MLERGTKPNTIITSCIQRPRGGMDVMTISTIGKYVRVTFNSTDIELPEEDGVVLATILNDFEERLGLLLSEAESDG